MTEAVDLSGHPDPASNVGAGLEVNGLAKVLPDGTTLLENVSFQVRPGEFVGLLGASGAGKSLTLRCLLALTRPTAGQMTFHDAEGTSHRLDELSGRGLRLARRRIGVIFQGSNLVRRLKVIENVMIGRLGYVNPVRAWIYGFTDAEARLALQALERTHIAHLAHRVTGSLSGGEMQRVAIARAIHQQPDLYLADEPISSLDPGNARAIMELLVPLARRRAVLGVFHQPAMVARYCSRAIALKDGKVCYDGSPRLSTAWLEQIYGEELHELATSVPSDAAVVADPEPPPRP